MQNASKFTIYFLRAFHIVSRLSGHVPMDHFSDQEQLQELAAALRFAIRIAKEEGQYNAAIELEHVLLNVVTVRG